MNSTVKSSGLFNSSQNFQLNSPNLSTKGCTSYAQFYKKLCISNEIQLNNCIMHGLKGQDLIINIDNLAAEDVEVFSIILRNCFFEHIKIYGHGSKLAVKPKKHVQLKKQQVYFTQTEHIVTIMKELKQNLQKTQITIILHMENLKLKNDIWTIFSEGVQGNKTVKELYINNCQLKTQELELISSYIAANTSIIALDLENNRLGDDAGRVIGKILSAHSQRRDEIIWMYSLRGEDPEEDISLLGLCELNLQGNQISTRAIIELCYFLQYDGWTRSINFRDNKIQEQGVKELNLVLDNNESIVSLDLRGNPGFNEYYSQQIHPKLLRNQKIFKKRYQLQLSNSAAEGQDQNQEDDEHEVQYRQYQRNPFQNEEIQNHNLEGFQQQQEDISEGQNYQNGDQNEIQNQGENDQFDQQIGEEFNEATGLHRIDEVIESIYDEQNLGEFPKNCANCKEFEKKVIKSEFRNKSLQVEILKLRQALNLNINQGTHSLSAIQPYQIGEVPAQYESGSNYLIKNQEGSESGEMFNKIEGLMTELTRMMDNLENQQNYDTKNFTYHLSNTTNTNNQTYQLLLNNNNNNTFSHFLGQSNNNSNLLPITPNTQQQQILNQQQIQQQQNYLAQQQQNPNQNNSNLNQQQSHNSQQQSQNSSNHKKKNTKNKNQNNNSG